MIVVGLMTCDRVDYTRRTLESFAQHNDLTKFKLIHADDASKEDNRAVAAAHGFETVVQSQRRYGVRVMRSSLIDAAVAMHAEWLLLLENDIETVRPFPFRLFRYVCHHFPEVYTLRLYGQYKDVEKKEPCLTTHKRQFHQTVEWLRMPGAPEPAERGLIHWSAQPAVTRLAELSHLHQTGHEPRGWTARVVENVTSHIGHDNRTPGRRL